MKTYTYDSANRLIQVNDGSSVTSLTYNGLGQRLSMDAAGVIAQYVLDGDLPLTATSSGNTTFFLYGRGPIGEKTAAWNYSLLDGTGNFTFGYPSIRLRHSGQASAVSWMLLPT